MKILKGISMFGLAAVLLIGCKQTSNKQEETTPTDSIATEQVSSNEISGTLQKATFQVEGMACAIGCAKVIEKKLANMEGIQAATVDFESKTATIEFDDARQNPETITKTVEEIANGAYTVENLTIETENV
ncbi:MAG TPA: heavy metal-associated domain-containing protein [Flavobacterium sp.]|nr:heavy metal-associated domain-containing protein [Flavobacterium sp.]